LTRLSLLLLAERISKKPTDFVVGRKVGKKIIDTQVPGSDPFFFFIPFLLSMIIILGFLAYPMLNVMQYYVLCHAEHINKQGK
jgi:hypothetical protein